MSSPTEERDLLHNTIRTLVEQILTKGEWSDALALLNRVGPLCEGVWIKWIVNAKESH